LEQGVAERSSEGALRGMRNQVENDFGVAAGLENCTAGFQIAAEFLRVGDVTVVCDGDQALAARDREGLRVQYDGVAGGRVAGMTDGMIAWKFRQNLVGEDVGNVPHRFMGVNLIAVAGGDAGALLAAMLQGIKSEIRELRCFRMAVNGNDTALFTEFIKHG